MNSNRRVAEGVKAPSEVRTALDAWQRSVVVLDVLDPVTTEIVRLRCARHHDCHT